MTKIDHFLDLIECSRPIPLNGDYEIELTEEQERFVEENHLVFPANTTILMISLDDLIETFKYDKNVPIDNTIQDMTEGLILTEADKKYLTEGIAKKIIINSL